VRDIWTSFTDVATHLPHDSNVLIAVEQRVFLIFTTSAAAMSSLVRFEAGVRQDDDESLGVFVRGGDRDMLFGNEAW
jgi:hypothetical protein